MRRKGIKQLKSDIRYLGIDKYGRVKFFRKKSKLKKEGFMYVRKMRKCKLKPVMKEDIPTITAKEPHFNLHIEPLYITR